jgi:hypothetical protein
MLSGGADIFARCTTVRPRDVASLYNSDLETAKLFLFLMTVSTINVVISIRAAKIFILRPALKRIRSTHCSTSSKRENVWSQKYFLFLKPKKNNIVRRKRAETWMKSKAEIPVSEKTLDM